MMIDLTNSKQCPNRLDGLLRILPGRVFFADVANPHAVADFAADCTTAVGEIPSPMHQDLLSEMKDCVARALGGNGTETVALPGSSRAVAHIGVANGTLVGYVEPLSPVATEAIDRIQKLSDREKEVLALVTDGQSNKQIASQLQLSIRSIENHRSRLRKKLGADGVADLARIDLLANGVVPHEGSSDS